MSLATKLEFKEILVDNALVMSRFSLSSKQLDLLFVILALLKKDQTRYQIHISELEEITQSEWNYSRLKKDTKILGSHVFEVETGMNSIQIWLFQSVVYENKSGYFTISISEDAKPYLFNLKRNFTAIELRSILSCSSLYAKRIYCIALQFTVKKEVKSNFTIELDELRRLLYTEPNQKLSSYSHFKKRVLDIAQIQINENTNMRIAITPKKKMGKYKILDFDIYYKNRFENIKLPEYERIKFVTYDWVKSYGFSDSQAHTISTNVLKSEFEKIVKDTTERMQKREIKYDNMLAYLVGIFQNKGVLPRKNT